MTTFKSTRTSDGQTVSFKDVLFRGYAPDGGLFVPSVIPILSDDDMVKMSGMSYSELCKTIIRLFIGVDEIPTEDLNDIIDAGLASFDVDEIVPVVDIGDDVFVAELFHGLTASFKDLALSVVGKMLDYFLRKEEEKMIIIVGTSGDTGSAAIQCVKDSDCIDIIVLYPKGRTSDVQELQMITIIQDNVFVFEVNGTSDDLDETIKVVLEDTEYVEANNICSINSINWGRIMIQTVHFFYSFFQVNPNLDKDVIISLPTGAAGNLTSGTIARKMGLPIEIVCAVNQNDILYRCITKGDFSISEQVIPTIAPAMDIQVPYNWERVTYYLSNEDSEVTKSIMEEFYNNGSVTMPESLFEIITQNYQSATVNQDEIKETILHVWKNSTYAIDPHTAIGVKAALDMKSKTDKTFVCSATASPFKFPELMKELALDSISTPHSISELYEKNTKKIPMGLGEEAVSQLKDTITTIRKK